MPERRTFTQLQLAVLQILWQQGEATVQEVQSKLNLGRDLALTTVGTILSRLEKEGVVSHRVKGRLFFYKALIPQQEVRQDTVAEVLSSVFERDVIALVSELLNTSDITAYDIAKVKELIAEWEAKQENQYDE